MYLSISSTPVSTSQSRIMPTDAAADINPCYLFRYIHLLSFPDMIVSVPSPLFACAVACNTCQHDEVTHSPTVCHSHSRRAKTPTDSWRPVEPGCVRSVIQRNDSTDCLTARSACSMRGGSSGCPSASRFVHERRDKLRSTFGAVQALRREPSAV